MIDTNVHLSRWPFRRLRGDEPADLAAHLRERKAEQAWAGSFDGLLHKDIGAANTRLAADCRKYGSGFLLPFGEIHPGLPDWQEDMRLCHEQHKMPGIRLHPAYHGYTLKDRVFADVLAQAAKRALAVQLVASMEDERTQHPLVRVPSLDLAPLADVVRSTPGLRLLVSNYGHPTLAKQIAAAGKVYFDFAMLEGPGHLARLLDDVSQERVVFGSHFPLFYFEAAVLKVKEAGLNEAQTKAVFTDNARRFLQVDVS
ncbi:MAG: amidohydrolase family protein [Bryobacteraceae bacterium]